MIMMILIFGFISEDVINLKNHGYPQLAIILLCMDVSITE